MKKSPFTLLMVGIISLILMLSGCGGDTASPTTVAAVDEGDGGDTALKTAVVTGKVSLSSVVSGKPRLQKAPQGKPGSARYQSTMREKSPFVDLLPQSPKGKVFEDAFVYLFDAERPEWLNPVAKDTTGADGGFRLATLINASKNLNSDGSVAYVDGDPIPAGKYTMQAVGFDPATGEMSIALQSGVRDFSGESTPEEEEQNALVAQPSEVVPKVQTMLGLSRNTDGSQTWGNAGLELAPNTAIQVNFNMAMNRATIENGISISPEVDGYWAISADWLSATFYLNDGVTIAAGSYTVTVNGEDGDSVSSVKNVYNNKLEKTATASFMVKADAVVDTTPPVVTIVSPTNGAVDVDITEPVRISSTKMLDVNGLLLQRQATTDPSLGAQPGILYIGKRGAGDDVRYVYEFKLGNPLTLGTAYNLSITGGKSLTGLQMEDLSLSFTTAAATVGVIEVVRDVDAEGYDASKVVKANAQADVKDVFGKWARAMNDRSLAQVQSLMHGEFVLEYNTQDGFDKADEDRSGYFDLTEFGAMLEEDFLTWDRCGTTMSGDIVGDINIDDSSPDFADFEFILTGTSTSGTKDCADAAPKDSMYAKAAKINGGWFIYKASEGIDTRKEAIKTTSTIVLTAPVNDAVISLGVDETGEELTEEFTWEAPTDAAGDVVLPASYVMMFVDVRDPRSGFAFILPPSYTSIDIPPNDAVLFDEDQPVAAEVNKAFGFDRDFNPRPGVEIDWQILALGTNTVKDVIGKRQTSLTKDVIGSSKPQRFKIAGSFEELLMTVTTFDEAGNVVVDDAGEPVEMAFSEYVGGYDVGAAPKIRLTVTTPRLNATVGIVNVSGNTFLHEQLHFNTEVLNDAGEKVGLQGYVDIELSQGNNGIEVADANIYANTGGGDMPPPGDGDMPPLGDGATGGEGDMPPPGDGAAGGEGGMPPPGDGAAGGEGDMPPPGEGAAGGGGYNLQEWFNVKTTGGEAPVIAIESVTVVDADADAALEGGSWAFYDAGTGSEVIIVGTVRSEFTMSELDLNLFNDRLGARDYRRVEVDDAGSFTVTMSLYKGENWLDIGGQGCDSSDNCNWYSANFGVMTSEGIPWVPPISVTNIAYVDGVGEVIQRDDWGDGGNWEAIPSVTEEDGRGVSVVITGKLEYATDSTDSENVPRYNAGSEGAWEDGRLSVDNEGNFELIVDLYTGWNNIGLNDVNNNWYGINLITEFGKKVIRPEILTLNGIAYADALNERGDYVLPEGECSVTITGTALDGEVRMSWFGNGEKTDGSWSNGWEEIVTEIDSTSNDVADHTFSATFSMIGGSGYNFVDNFIDINDSAWNWMGVRILTTSDCTYEAPLLTVSSVVTAEGGILEKTETYTHPNYDESGNAVQVESGARFAASAADPWTAVSTASIVISGASNKADRRIGASMQVCGREVKLDAVHSATTENLDGVYSWSMTVAVYPGNNGISIRDGGNNYQIDLDALNSNEMPPPAIDLLVTDAVFETKSEGNEDPCGGGGRWSIDAGGAAVITVTGVTQAEEGKGEWYADGLFGTFDIAADGSFAFEVSAYNGHNRINVNDSEWNHAELEVSVTNGVDRPQFVEITSHTHGDTLRSTDVVVSGVIYANPAADVNVNFEADWVSGYISTCGEAGCSWSSFSSDPAAAQWGDKLITLAEDVNGDMTFTLEGVTLASLTDSIEIEVRADGQSNGNFMGHGNAIKLNVVADEFCPDCNAARVWKARVKAPVPSVSDDFKAWVSKRHRIIGSRIAQ